MSIETETPSNQYAKREYYIRLVGRVPINVPASNTDATSDGDASTELRLEGTPLCSIDVTMSHVAVMYAAGRLLDSIREPFNASIIRAEMDLLRDRAEKVPTATKEHYENWKKENHKAKGIDPLVSENYSDPKKARGSVPQFPYLCQLLFKSFCVGNKPGFWCGAREMTHVNGDDGVRNVRGRAGAGSLDRRGVQTWFLYIDVSDPLRPRYAFMEEQNIIDSTRLVSDGRRHPLYIFNGREHAYQLMIPESELFSDAKRFGEEEWSRHMEGISPTGRRKFIKLPEDPTLDPDYKELLVSRMKRAQEHPAVVRMQAFGWLTVNDVIKSDGSALLQGIWRYSLNSAASTSHSNSIVRMLLDRKQASRAVIIRSAVLNELDHPDSPQWENSFTGLPELIAPEISLKFSAFRALLASLPKIPGGMLTVLDNLSGTELLTSLKLKLSHILKDRSSKLGTGYIEEALEWLPSAESVPEPQDRLSDDNDHWVQHDDDTPENNTGESTNIYNEDTLWILLYQGLCYRASVALERLSKSFSDSVSVSGSESQNEAALGATYEDPWDPSSRTEFPGRVLGDVAHPAFDVSYFPRISESQLLNALKIWSNAVWLPDLEEGHWDFVHGTPIPLRTLNVSGCQFVTRDTIRQAIQIAPSITRIIMIGCRSFHDADMSILSLDGTLNNVDCLLTRDTVRDPFCDPRRKKQWRDEAYKLARELLPQAPNEKVRARLDSVPGVFFNSTKEFKFKHSTKIYDTYHPQGLPSRALSHSFARPPALGFEPASGQVVCGPPRFSIVLATHTIHDIPATGATLPRVPIDTGIEGIGTNGCGLTSVWRGIIDLLELLGDPYIRNKQRWNLIRWSLVVKSCFSDPGQKWGKKSGLTGGGEFYGFPAYFKGGPGQANEEWIFAYQFRDVVARMQTYWANGPFLGSFVYPESSTQDCWAFIRYGRDANPLSREIPTVVLYNVREFRQAICPGIPILEDEAKWMARVEDVLANGTWHPSYPIINWGHDRLLAHKGDPMWTQMRTAAEGMTKPKYMKDVPHELMLLIEWMMTCQMNAGSDPF
ncbi:unnamed protein product [Rhizoctonia solani]|uniref:Uncharacterized protein n=1 Tax=Rhizoctonia solani TaxID=456999 RepID=A0A8H2W7Z3_9AGAM|nr:unnamed protein product [Rhizoctonia solani]